METAKAFVFIGGTYRGAKLFKKLLEEGHIPIQCFFLKEDGHEIEKVSDELMELAKVHNIPSKITKKIAAGELTSCDFGIVCGWRTLIPKPDFPLIAAHDSLLPKYRGFAPLQWAMINGETQTGVTLFIIDDGMDTGDIVEQIIVPILQTDYAVDVRDKITDATIQSYLKLFTQPITAKPQTGEASYTCKRTPEDGRIDWSRRADIVHDLIRALAYPFPGAFCMYKGKKYIIQKAERNMWKNYVGIIPGRIVGIDPLEVLCGEGTITITEWEVDGERKKPYITFFGETVG